MPPVRFETSCLFCGKVWSVQLGSPTLTCSCGAAINVLKDTSVKAAQDLEEKVYSVLMKTWQERNGNGRAMIQNGNSKRMGPGPLLGQNKSPKGMIKKSTLIVQCPRCSVNVIVPDVKVFQCGACGQYMTIDKHASSKKPSKGGGAPQPPGQSIVGSGKKKRPGPPITKPSAKNSKTSKNSASPSSSTPKSTSKEAASSSSSSKKTTAKSKSPSKSANAKK